MWNFLRRKTLMLCFFSIFHVIFWKTGIWLFFSTFLQHEFQLSCFNQCHARNMSIMMRILSWSEFNKIKFQSAQSSPFFSAFPLFLRNYPLFPYSRKSSPFFIKNTIFELRGKILFACERAQRLITINSI